MKNTARRDHLVTDIQLHEYNREQPVRPVSDDGWCQVRRVDIYSIDHAGRGVHHIN